MTCYRHSRRYSCTTASNSGDCSGSPSNPENATVSGSPMGARVAAGSGIARAHSASAASAVSTITLGVWTRVPSRDEDHRVDHRASISFV